MDINIISIIEKYPHIVIFFFISLFFAVTQIYYRRKLYYHKDKKYHKQYRIVWVIYLFIVIIVATYATIHTF
jgi:uncharacterized membrane protein